MASHYLQYSAPSVKVLQGSQVLATQRCWCLSVPTGVGFVYEVPQIAFEAGTGATILDSIGQDIEALVTSHHVTGGQGVQDFDENGLLADYVDLTVTYDRGALPALTATAHVQIDLFTFSSDLGEFTNFLPPGAGGLTPADIVDATYAHLVALAA